MINNYYTNKAWQNRNIPVFSIVTAVYNRIEHLSRPLDSVSCQTFRDFEYIIIDDGSEESPDKIIFDYMEKQDFPVMYVKKDNGGAHTARNIGIKNARGEYLLILDSDDELVPNALEKYYEAWMSIDQNIRGEYREVVARNIDEYGNQLSTPYPDDINLMPKYTALRIANKTGQHISVNRTSVLKENPFPEPEGVKFVNECILWKNLDSKYRSYYINEVLYVYYRDIPDSLTHTKGKKKNTQHCINWLWFYIKTIESYGKYYMIDKEMVSSCLYYSIYLQVLTLNRAVPKYDWFLNKKFSFKCRLLVYCFYLPSVIVALWYKKNMMSNE